MPKSAFSWSQFNRVPIVGILRNVSFEELKMILPIAHNAGLTTIEITVNTPKVFEMIAHARDIFNEKMNIGVGTVCTVSEFDQAIEAGSEFIVTPVLNKKIIQKSLSQEIPIFPGAYTPTEIHKAWSWGVPMVKVFPATNLGAGFIKDLKGPFPNIKLIPTGGVNLENIIDFQKAGAAGFGIGSPLFDKKLIADKNWKALENHISQFIKIINPR